MRFPISGHDDVLQLQQRLRDLGLDVTADGIPGPQTTEAVRAFQTDHVDASGAPLQVDGIPGPATWASLLAAGASAAPPPTASVGRRGQALQVEGIATPPPAATAPSAGFDTAFYPGDAAMRTWKDHSPYTFVGYYLSAPAHPSASFMGKRQTLAGMGWGMLVLYVGRQVQGPGAATPPDAAGGHQHGADALAKTLSEGFPPGTVIYLDVEPMDRIPANMIDYVNAWLSQFAGKSYLPGLYCHVKNAVELRAKTSAAAARISFWVSGGSHFTAGVSRPADSGIPFAAIWQGALDVKKTFGGVTIDIDENAG